MGSQMKKNSGVCWKTVETKSLNVRSVIAGERRGRGENHYTGFGL